MQLVRYYLELATEQYSNNQYKKHSNQQMPYMKRNRNILQGAFFFYNKFAWLNLRAKLYKMEVGPLDCHNKVLWSLLTATERMNDNGLGNIARTFLEMMLLINFSESWT
jgi:hypothetical protein